MDYPDFIQTEHQTIRYLDAGLCIGQVLFRSIHKVIWHNHLFNITGRNTKEAIKTLTGIETEQCLEGLQSQRRLFPNTAIISKTLGLAQLSLGEATLAEDQKNTPEYFQESISSLERALEQDPGDPESTLNLVLAYCYAEDLEEQGMDDYSELIDALLEEVPPTLLPVIADACAVRGRVYFGEGRATLGFNFMKQELFLWRYQQLLAPQNTELRNRLEANGSYLIKQCIEQKWFGIADQLKEQIEVWLAETAYTDSLDARLVEAAEFERAGKAYLSHKDKVSALSCFEEHTSLMKLIYQDHAPLACYANLLIASYECLIDLYYQLNLDEKGDLYQQEMIDLIEELLKTYPQDEFYLNALAACNETLAERRLAENKLTEARSLFNKSLEISKTLVLIDPEMEDYKSHQSNTLRRIEVLKANPG